MDVGEHLAGLREAVDEFATHATAAGLEAPVPTTPDWDVRRLVAHQGLVHRWATATVLDQPIDEDAVEGEGLSSPDPVAWLREGAARLADVLQAAPDDLEAMTFLADAPPAKRFWARRQCHETTIHAVDALAASLGRRPRADDTWIGRDLALDGVDELLTGFVPRPRSRLRSPDPLTLSIEADDADDCWVVTVHERPPVTRRGASDSDADIVIRGPAVALYLTLWNRSDELSGALSGGGFDLWTEGTRVTWA